MAFKVARHTDTESLVLVFADSPYIVSISPGRICAAQCVAWGESLDHFAVNGEMNVS